MPKLETETMNYDEIEGLPLSELPEREFNSVALLIGAKTDLNLIRTEDPEAEFVLTDDDGFEWIVSRKLTTGSVFNLAKVIHAGNQHAHGEFFRQRPFYDLDRRKAAANDHE